jgi:hypothetical protein
MDKETTTPTPVASSDDERGKEPSQAYRQNLRQRDEDTYANVGTFRGSPRTERAHLRLICHGRGRAPVVVDGVTTIHGGRENRLQGKGGQ